MVVQMVNLKEFYLVARKVAWRVELLVGTSVD